MLQFPKYEPAFNLPPIVGALCLINIIVFASMPFLSDRVIESLALVPARFTGDGGEASAWVLAVSPVTHMFLHAGVLHLAVNLGTLMAFGAGLERRLGGRAFLLFYLTTGILGALVHVLFYPHSTDAMIGASGAISGLFGGVVVMLQEGDPRGGSAARLLPFALIWIGISIFFGVFGMPGADGPIAWATHVGGFVSGMALYGWFKGLKIKR